MSYTFEQFIPLERILAIKYQIIIQYVDSELKLDKERKGKK